MVCELFYFYFQHDFLFEKKTYCLQLDVGSYYYCVRGTRTQPLICVGCPVQLIREVLLKLDFEIAFEALAYVLPHFHALAHVVILVLGVHLSKVC